VVNQADLIHEIDTLSPRHYGEVFDFIGYMREKRARKVLSLEQAAEMAIEIL